MEKSGENPDQQNQQQSDPGGRRHKIEQLVDQVEEELQREFEREVQARLVGERVMRRLFALDEVACIRFASEYYAFKSIDDLRRQMDEMKDHVPDSKDQQKLFV